MDNIEKKFPHKIRLLLTIVLSISLSSNFSLAKALDTETVPNLDWNLECKSTIQSLPVVDIVKILKAKSTSNFRLSKSEEAKLMHSVEVLQFNCDEITEEFWKSNRNELVSEFTKARKIIQSLNSRYLQSIPITITCYKAGTLKKVSGLKPACPKGFKKVK